MTKVVDVGFAINAKNGKVFQTRQSISRYSLLRFDWPDAELVAENLCEYLTDGIKAEGVPVASHYLDAALEKYSGVVYGDRPQKCDDQARIGFFVEEILNSVSSMAISVKDQAGAVWSVGSKDGFAQWLTTCVGELTVFTRAYDESEILPVRQFVYELITPPRIKGVLQRRKYDEAVVRGALATVA